MASERSRRGSGLGKRGFESGMPDRRIQRPSSMKPNQEPTMNRYQAQSPRAAISLAAVAMTALTLGLSVLPAQMERGRPRRSRRRSGSRRRCPGGKPAPGDGMPIVVYGVREQETGLQQGSCPARRTAAEAANLTSSVFPRARTPRRATGSVKGRARCVRPFAFVGRTPGPAVSRSARRDRCRGPVPSAPPSSTLRRARG